MATVDDIKVKVNVDNSQALSALRQVTAEAQRMSEALKRTSTGMGGVSTGIGGIGGVSAGGSSVIAAAVAAAVASGIGASANNKTAISNNQGMLSSTISSIITGRVSGLIDRSTGGIPVGYGDNIVGSMYNNGETIDVKSRNVPPTNFKGPTRGGFVGGFNLSNSTIGSQIMKEPFGAVAKIAGTAYSAYKAGEYISENFLSTGKDKAGRFSDELTSTKPAERLKEIREEVDKINSRTAAASETWAGFVSNIVTGDTVTSLKEQASALNKIAVAEQKAVDATNAKIKAKEAEAKAQAEIDKQNNVGIYYSREKLALLEKEEAKRKQIVEERNAAFINSGDEESRVRMQGEYDVIKLRERLAVESNETNRGYIKDLIDFRVDETEKALKKIVDAEQMAAIDAKIAWDEALQAQTNKDQAVKNRAKQDLFSYRNSIGNLGNLNSVFPDEALALLRQSVNEHHYISMYDADTGR